MTYSTLKSTAAAFALTAGTAFAGDAMKDTDAASMGADDQAKVVKTDDGYDLKNVTAGTDTDTPAGEQVEMDYSSTDQEVETLDNASMGKSTMVPDSGVGFGTEDDDGMLSDNTLTVADLVGLDVIGSNGQDVGEIEAIIKDGARYTAVVAVGGFLGLAEHDVAVPLDEFAISPEQVNLSGWTEEQLKSQPEIMPEQYTGLSDDMIVDVAS